MAELSSDSQNPYASPATPTDDSETPDSPNTPDAPLVQPISFSGDLSLDDFIHAWKSIGRSRFPSYLRLPAKLAAALAAGLALVGGTLPFFIVGGLRVALLDAVFMLLTVFIVVICLSKTGYRRAWRDWCAKYGNQTIRISEDDFESVSEKEHTKIEWSAFKRSYVTNRLALLFFRHGKNRYQIFPRDCFRTKHDWECFIGLLDRKLPRC